MNEDRQAENAQDPGPVKESDAERVSSEEAERVPPAEGQDPSAEQREQSS
jgi:hypothetical protein